jgi:hypothetical protein
MALPDENHQTETEELMNQYYAGQYMDFPLYV